MKKTLLFVAAASLGVMASAQTVILPPTVEEADAAGLAGLWDNGTAPKYQYGYVLPNGFTLVDDASIKVTVDNGSASKPGANVGCVTWVDGANVGSNINTNNTKYFDRAFYMGSAATDGAFEAVYSLELISDGIKQSYAVFNVTAKENGKLEMFCNRNDKKFTIYVWDRTAKDAAGTYVLANTTHTDGATNAKELITKATVGLMKDHEYWIFCSGNGANAHMYEMIFTPCSATDYSVQSFDASKYSTVIAPPTVEEAEAAGWDGLWPSEGTPKYQYGYVLPNGTVVADTEDLKAVVNNGSASKPGANVAWTSGVFPASFNMGSAAGEEGFESVYSLEIISDGIKQPYAVFEIEAKKSGELTMYTNRSNKKYTMYVWDRTVNEEAGTYVLVSTTQTSDDKNAISTATVGLMKDHKYWIFCSNNGANTNMYAMGYNNYDAPNYGYAGVAQTGGISDVTVDAMPQSNIIYNFQGQIVDENYKGFVIKNGKKYLQK